MENGNPTLMLIIAGGNDSKAYVGPTDLRSLVEFIDDQTGRPKKVLNQPILKTIYSI